MPRDYGELVRGYRLAAGLTQEQLSALSGLGVRTISDIERGRTVPHRSTADRLAGALQRGDLAGDSVRGPAVVAGESAILPPRPAGGPADAGSLARQLVPQQLPGGVRPFIGRASELAVLTSLLNQSAQERPGMVVISAIGGTAGVGKTALAVHWAHQVAADFPDGQLYVNLRGYDPGQPLEAADALAGFLRALGVAGQDIPPEADERASWYRSLLAGRRMLVVLDNARSHEQVRPLLPGASSCVVVVTSRHALAGLIARDGAVRLDLDPLPLADAVGLLETLIGRRARTDPGAAERLAAQCCRLPLALRVAAERVAARPDDSVADLVAELDDQRRRLDLLDAGGDPATMVRAVFSWSYQSLDPAAARAFRLTGLHPGPGLDHYTAAALVSCTAAEAERLLDRLAQAHLVHAAGKGGYEMHDLLRAYARELSQARETDDDRQDALTRLLDHYLHTAAAATDTLEPAEPHRRPRIPQPATPTPPVTDPAAARAWLDAHRAGVIAAIAHATDYGWPSHAIRLSATMAWYLSGGGHYYSEGVTVHSCARRAARNCGDQAAEARALISLSAIDRHQGRYPQATRHLLEAQALFRQVGDQAGETRALGDLATVEAQQGYYPQAASHQRQVLAKYRASGDRVGEACTLASLGDVDVRQGRYRHAVTSFRRALDLFRETGAKAGEGRALGSLGDVDLRQGRYEQAARQYQHALAAFRQIGDVINEAYALASLGNVDLRLGRYEQAASRLRAALAVFRQADDRVNEAFALASLGDLDLRQGRWQQALPSFRQALTLLRQAGERADEAGVLSGIGEAFLAAGQSDEARAQDTAALTLASQIGDRSQQARAHRGLGHAFLTEGDLAGARRHWQQALTLYSRLGAPEADEVRASLRRIDPG